MNKSILLMKSMMNTEEEKMLNKWAYYTFSTKPQNKSIEELSREAKIRFLFYLINSTIS